MPETEDIDLEKVDLETDGPEVVVLTERAPVPSVHEFFVGMIEEILDARIEGLAVHDHITDTDSPEPWLEELLASFVKDEDVWIVVSKVLESDEELRSFVVDETRKVLKANLGTIGEAVKGALEDLKVFVTLNEHTEALAQLQQLVDNKVGGSGPMMSTKQFETLVSTDFHFAYMAEHGHDYAMTNMQDIGSKALEAYWRSRNQSVEIGTLRETVKDLQKKIDKLTEKET